MLWSDNIPANYDKFVAFWTEVYKYFMIIADVSQNVRFWIPLSFLICFAGHKSLTSWVKFYSKVVVIWCQFGGSNFGLVFLLLSILDFLHWLFCWFSLVWGGTAIISNIMAFFSIVEVLLIWARVTFFRSIFFGHHS